MRCGLHASQATMPTLIKSAKAIAIIVGAFAVLILLRSVSDRDSLVYWLLFSAVVLPVFFWRGLGFWQWSLSALAVAIALAASPVDFTVRTGKLGLRVLPVHYGNYCKEGTDCRGCDLHGNPPRQSIVLSF
jgi:hypothetical protein